MACHGFAAQPCVVALDQRGTEMDDDIPKLKLVLRGFLGAVQIVEHTTIVESPAIAWVYASTYFAMDAPHSECDRYTVDTYWVY